MYFQNSQNHTMLQKVLSNSEFTLTISSIFQYNGSLFDFRIWKFFYFRMENWPTNMDLPKLAGILYEK